MREKIIGFFETNKEASTVLLGNGRALKKRWETLDYVSCFPHFFRALPFPACFTTEQSIVEASLFVKVTRPSFFGGIILL